MTWSHYAMARFYLNVKMYRFGTIIFKLKENVNVCIFGRVKEKFANIFKCFYEICGIKF